MNLTYNTTTIFPTIIHQLDIGGFEHIKAQTDDNYSPYYYYTKYFQNSRIDTIKKTIEEVFNVDIESHSLYFFGKKNK